MIYMEDARESYLSVLFITHKILLWSAAKMRGLQRLAVYVKAYLHRTTFNCKCSNTTCWYKICSKLDADSEKRTETQKPLV